jgi:hypothetical protein
LEKKDEQIISLSKTIQGLMEDNAELPELRGKVTQFRIQNEELKKQVASAERNATAACSQLQSAAENARPDSVSSSAKEILLAQAPFLIRNKIALQYPGAKTGEVVQACCLIKRTP